MDCLRSFNFTIANQSNYTAPNFVSWVVGGQNFWTFEISSAVGSKYNVQGFKNINVFKIEITGDISSTPRLAGFQCLVQNWSLDLEIVGQNSASVGNVLAAPNPFGMIEQPLNPFLRLSKFQNSVCFESPIQSVKELNVKNIYADGIANNSLLSAQIGYVINVTVFYKYEGE